jgi:arylformamidase
MQRVGQPVERKRLDPGVKQQDFKSRSGGGVKTQDPVEQGIDVAEEVEHGWLSSLVGAVESEKFFPWVGPESDAKVDAMLDVRIYDLSPELSPELAGWPGDKRFALESTWSQERLDSVTVGCVHGSVHLGTHVDAPRHFLREGADVSELPLEPFWGWAQVLDLTHIDESRPLRASDLEGVVISEPRLLLKTRASLAPESEFFKDFVYPSSEFVAVLKAHGVVLLGTDAPSMDRWDDPTVPGHRALFSAGISILEGLRLMDVPRGVVGELSALPLRFKGADGGWTRAALRVAAIDIIRLEERA